MKKPYPGSFILNEVGTRKDMAQAYGVSERTIYRWLNKAAKESGAASLPKVSNYPGATAVGKFKGTRKELAAKYGISERTAYRWINKARKEMETTGTRGAYPGESILTESGSNKDLAAKYGVSVRTIQRWKEKAEAQKGLRPRRRPRVNLIPPTAQPEMPTQEPLEPIEPDYEEPIIEEPEEPKTEIPEPTPEDLEEPFEVDTSDALDDRTMENLDAIVNALFDNDLLEENSLFKDMDQIDRALYIYQYLEYQQDNFPWKFYKKGQGDIGLKDTDDIINIDIWGSDFEFWLQNEIEMNK